MEPGDFVTPRFIGRDGNTVRICLVGHQAMLLAGDWLELDVEVAAGARLELVESSATIAYNGRGGRAGWRASVRIAGSGSLVWRSEPFVVAAGADVERTLDIAVDDGGVAALYESLVLGRHQELGGALLSHTRASYQRSPVLVETLDLSDPVARSRPGVLGRYRVLTSALVVGLPVCTAVTPHTSPLAGPGGLARVLEVDAHCAEERIRPFWESWRDEVQRHPSAAVRPSPSAPCRVG